MPHEESLKILQPPVIHCAMSQSPHAIHLASGVSSSVCLLVTVGVLGTSAVDHKDVRRRNY